MIESFFFFLLKNDFHSKKYRLKKLIVDPNILKDFGKEFGIC